MMTIIKTSSVPYSLGHFHALQSQPEVKEAGGTCKLIILP
jgi:hypothetical protein